MSAAVIIMRSSKIVMTGGIGFWAFLVVLGNLTDYDSNWAFVQGVLTMDTIFPESQLNWRAVTNPAIHQAAYWIIIAWEALTSLAFLAAACMMTWHLRSERAEFQRARTPLALGVALAFALWFVGFMAIGGEWFAMWQSETWNGQEAAFRFTIIILAAAIYVLLDTDGGRDPAR